MTLISEGTAASAWPLLLTGRMDRSARASSVWGDQPVFESAQVRAVFAEESSAFTPGRISMWINDLCSNQRIGIGYR